VIRALRTCNECGRWYANTVAAFVAHRLCFGHAPTTREDPRKPDTAGVFHPCTPSTCGVNDAIKRTQEERCGDRLDE
jgi:hypothetical protein